MDDRTGLADAQFFVEERCARPCQVVALGEVEQAVDGGTWAGSPVAGSAGKRRRRGR